LRAFAAGQDFFIRSAAVAPTGGGDAMHAWSTLAPAMAIPPAAYEAEHALARAVAAGERAASERMARMLLPQVRRVARAMVTRPADVDDASQVALLEVLRSAGNYRGEGPLEGWARRIATRAILRWSGRQRLRDAKTEPLAMAPDPRAAWLPSAVVEALPRPLPEYLAALPEVQRTAFVLRHSLGHTVPEIAALSDTAVPTIKSRLQKATEELRRLIRRDVALGARPPAGSPEKVRS
jgi:RNA polymerase sigma-70 factor, ECF subfamily